MNTVTKNRERTYALVGTALLTALIFVLQYMSAFIRFGNFSIASFALVTMVVGAALFGVGASTWLGFMFGVVVLISDPSVTSFLGINAVGTVLTVLIKGAAAGFASGFVYRLLEKRNRILASILAAITCPIVNTGVFLIGCRLFFFDAIASDGVKNGYNNTWLYIILFYVGWNFVFEFCLNLIVDPLINRIVDIAKASHKTK